MKRTKIKTKKINDPVKSLLILGLLLSYTFVSFAQNETEDKTLSPYFLVLSDDPATEQLPLKKTSANVNIVGVIADVTIKQVYKNESNSALEAIYTFPASTNAAVYAMEMTIGKRKIVAKIEEKNKARAQYNEAKAQGKRVSLLEQQRPNVFTMNVANIMPGDKIEVELKYTELLVPENGKYSFVYPTVVGPRYSEQQVLTASIDDQFLATPYQRENEDPFYNFNIDVFLSAGMPIQNISCSSHKVNIDYEQTSNAHIMLDASELKAGNRDYVLEYQLSGKKIASGLLLYENNDENFFLLTVQPPKQVKNEVIPPREYIFIVDVSGSMRGYPIEVTKKLLRNLVVNLRPTDKFNVILFAGTTGILSETSLWASPHNVNRAINFINSQRGGGGTRLLPALKTAFALPRHEESLSRSFVVVTDGYISVEQEAFDLVRKNSDQANTFVFGIGTGVNRHLIEGLAHVGMGEPFIVLDETNAYVEAEKFRQYISNPVLTQVKVNYGKFDVYDVEPLSVPDILAERPVIIHGKYRGPAEGTISIKGYSGKQRYKKTFNVSATKPNKRNSAIRYLWARERIKMLDDYHRLFYDQSKVKEVTDLGLKYNLITAYTSFLAIDEIVVNDNGNRKVVKQSLPLPQNVSNYAVGFDLAIEDDDMEELSITFYQAILISYHLPSEIRENASKYIEKDLIHQLNNYFETYNVSITLINVKVDAEGKVFSIEIEANSLNEEVEQSIKECISKWSFTQYNTNTQWEFDIRF